MLCSLTIEVPSGCRPGRHFLVIWGYLKMIADILIFYHYMPIVMKMLRGLPYVHRGVFCFLKGLYLVDIVFQILLVRAFYKETENKYKAYYTYTKMMWGISMVLVISYVICSLNDVTSYLTNNYYYIPEMLTTDMITMSVSAIIQAIMWNKIMKTTTDYATPPSKPVFKSDFTLQIGDSTDETEKEDDKTVEVIETTCGKAKLIE